MKETILKVKDNEYKLILGLKELRILERNIHESPINVIMRCIDGIVPTSTYIKYALHASMIKNHKNTTFSDVDKLIEDAQDEGKTILDFCAVIIEVFKNSNIIPKN